MWLESHKKNVAHSVSRLAEFGLIALCFLIGCNGPRALNNAAPILLFDGIGTSSNDVLAIEGLLNEKQLEFTKVNSDELNRLSGTWLKTHRLLIVPGGHYINMGNGLSADTARNVRDAVHGGLNYLGICAGGLLAGNATCNSFNLTDDVRFDFYSVVNQGVHKIPVWIDIAESSPQEHYWEDGPHFNGWGDVIGTYPDGTPAIVQGNHGKGWVVLCGVHPESPKKWRSGMTFTTPVRVNNDFAVKLIDAALNAAPLPHHTRCLN